MKRRLLVLTALAALAAGLVVFMPARVIEGPANRALAPGWRLATEGTPWHGSGVLHSLRAPDVAIPLSWEFAPAALLRLRAAWRISAGSPALSGPATVALGASGWELRDTAIVADAALLPQAHPGLALLAPAGQLAIEVPAGAWLRGGYGEEFRFEGEALFKAKNLALATFALQPLGDYDVKLTGRGNTLDYAFVRSAGAFKLDGGGSLGTGPRLFTYAGHATVSPELPPSLLSQLRASAQPLPDGRLRFDLKTAW